MKSKHTWGLGLVLSVVGISLQAALQLAPNDKPVCVFGSGPGTVNVTFSNLANQDFNGALRARLYQASSATAMLVNDISWKTLHALPNQTVLESARLDFPAVKAETEFLVQWLANSNQVIGTTEVWVYPTNLLVELKPLLGEAILGVLDPNGELTPTLKQNGVKFVDLGQTSLEDFSGKLAILGPFKSKAQMPDNMAQRCKTMATNGVTVLWIQPALNPQAPLQPSFYTVLSHTNAIVVAEAKLLSNFAASPSSQQRLVQLCRLALHPKPLVLPATDSQP